MRVYIYDWFYPFLLILSNYLIQLSKNIIGMLNNIIKKKISGYSRRNSNRTRDLIEQEGNFC